MQVTYRHYFGAQEDFDIACFTAELTCEPSEERQALDQGWLLHDDRWYQSRSTRMRLDSGSWTVPARDRHVVFTTDRDNVDAYLGIYNAYLEFKGFKHRYDPFQPNIRDLWMEYRVGSLLVGFTKLQQYHGGLESQFNAYLPDSGSTHGLDMLYFEANEAQSQGLKHLYIGSGYERGSIYKSRIKGFQWWTGSEWSDDSEAYTRLCQRDSSIKTLDDLAAASHHHSPS